MHTHQEYSSCMSQPMQCLDLADYIIWVGGSPLWFSNKVTGIVWIFPAAFVLTPKGNKCYLGHPKREWKCMSSLQTVSKASRWNLFWEAMKGQLWNSGNLNVLRQLWFARHSFKTWCLDKRRRGTPHCNKLSLEAIHFRTFHNLYLSAGWRKF